MPSISLATRSPPSYGIRYVSALKHIKPIPIKPIIAARRGLQDFDLLKYLNKGDSGMVYMAKDNPTDKQVALKIIPKFGSHAITAANEQRIQKVIENDGKSFLLPVLSSFHDTKHFYLVTEYMPGGDLAVELLLAKTFSEDRTKFYGAQLIVAVEQLKKYRIIHRDIKPMNILIDAQGYLRLADYGFAKKFDAPEEYEDLDKPDADFSFEVDGDCDSGSFLTNVPAPNFKTREICGTPHYMSPQRSSGKEYDDREDLWSLGVVFYLMLTGRLPFGDGLTDSTEVNYCIQHHQLQFESHDLVSDNAKVLIYGMLTKDPRTRLTLEQIKTHKFFEGIDWIKIANKDYEASWMPYFSPVPKTPMANRPVIAGRAYEDWLDPSPSFTYTSPSLDEAKLKSVNAVVVKPAPLKRFGAALAKVFKRKEKEATKAQDLSQSPSFGTTAPEYLDRSDDFETGNLSGDADISENARRLLQAIEQHIDDGTLDAPYDSIPNITTQSPQVEQPPPEVAVQDDPEPYGGLDVFSEYSGNSNDTQDGSVSSSPVTPSLSLSPTVYSRLTPESSPTSTLVGRRLSPLSSRSNFFGTLAGYKLEEKHILARRDHREREEEDARRRAYEDAAAEYARTKTTPEEISDYAKVQDHSALLKAMIEPSVSLFDAQEEEPQPKEKRISMFDSIRTYFGKMFGTSVGGCNAPAVL